MRRALSISVAAATAAVALGLSACGGTTPIDDPTSTPPVSTSPTSSSSTSTPAQPTPPVMPEAAKAHTKAGAIAFVKYLVEVVSYAQVSLDVSPLKPLMADGCQGCSSGIQAIQKIHSAGATSTGGQWILIRVMAQPVSNAGTGAFGAKFTIRSTSQTVHYPDGRKTFFPGAEVPNRVILNPTSTSWAVAFWTGS
jgi:hypothetical protein